MERFAFNDPIPQKRLDALEVFIEYWVGPRWSKYGATDEQLEHLSIPAPLKRLYKFCFNWPGDKSQQWGIPLLSRQNVLLKLETTTASQNEIPRGLVHFASENQGVTSWATLVKGEDPPVYGLDYEWGSFYNSPDGHEHRRWTEISPSLTDFLIGFALYELCQAKWINIPPSFISHIQNHPEKITQLIDSVHGHPVKLNLFDEDILMFHWDWEKPETMVVAARDETTIKKLQQFAGLITGIIFIIFMDSKGVGIKWQFGFGADGSGSVISSKTPKFLSRDTIPAGSININEVVKIVEPHLSLEKSADCHTETKVNRVVVDYMMHLTQPSKCYLSNIKVKALFQKAINFVENPSPELQEQLKNGSPLDW